MDKIRKKSIKKDDLVIGRYYDIIPRKGIISFCRLYHMLFLGDDCICKFRGNFASELGSIITYRPRYSEHLFYLSDYQENFDEV